MRKKAITAIITLISLVLVIGGIRFAIYGNSFTSDKDVTLENVSTTRWKEVPIRDGAYVAQASSLPFDLKETITNADYIFAGTIINRKEYEVEWVDDNGEQWGPFSSSVIEVKINKEYYGKSPVKSDIIRVYYPHSLSIVFGGSFLIKHSGDYVFVTRSLDESFIERKKAEAPEDKFEQEKYADVYISDSCYNLMPIDDGMVFVYHDYFSWNDENIEQAKLYTSVKTDKMASPDLVESGWIKVLKINDFNNAFLKLFENPEQLPSAGDLKKLREIDDKK